MGCNYVPLFHLVSAIGPNSSSDPPPLFFYILSWGSLDSLSSSTSSHHGEKRPVVFLSSSISSIREVFICRCTYTVTSDRHLTECPLDGLFRTAFGMLQGPFASKASGMFFDLAVSDRPGAFKKL
jgi:hypothetical protein